MVKIRDLALPPRRPKNGIDNRTALARKLHYLVVRYCLDANTPEEAEAQNLEIEDFLKNKARQHPDILFELSSNDFSHFLDALHLPFSRDSKCTRDLRVAKSLMLFERLAKFCREAAEKDAALWNPYADSMVKPNRDDFTPLMQACQSGDKEIYQSVASELSRLNGEKHLDDRTYARQFTAESKAEFSVLQNAIAGGNKNVYDRVAAELYQLHRHGLITNSSYTQQFTKESANHFTPVHTALDVGNMEIYHSLVGKLKKLRAEKQIDNETYAKQFTLATIDGHIPLHEAIHSGRPELLKAFIGDLKEALKLATPTTEEYVERYRAQLTKCTDTGWNVFHCATRPDHERQTPDGLIINALHDEFYEAFGAEAKKVMENLYRERIKKGMFKNMPAFSDQHRKKWVDDLMSLGSVDEDGNEIPGTRIKPTPYR